MFVRSIATADLDAVHRLLVLNGWGHRIGSVEELGRLILASQRALVAVVDDQIVGFARSISDGISNGYLSMVVVAESHRRQGIGQALQMIGRHHRRLAAARARSAAIASL